MRKGVLVALLIIGVALNRSVQRGRMDGGLFAVFDVSAYALQILCLSAIASVGLARQAAGPLKLLTALVCLCAVSVEVAGSVFFTTLGREVDASILPNSLSDWQNQFATQLSHRSGDVAAAGAAIALQWVVCIVSFSVAFAAMSPHAFARLLLWCLIAQALLWSMGAWSPLSSTLSVAVEGLIFRQQSEPEPLERGSENSSLFQTQIAALPNVVLVVHESLSGLVVQTERGAQALPFLKQTLAKDSKDFYYFHNARTVGGDSVICTPAVLNGRVPFSSESEQTAYFGLARGFRALGYETAVFSSYRTDWSDLPYYRKLNGVLRDSFDSVFSPETIKNVDITNDYGMDDRVLLQHFHNWTVARKPGGRPFFVVMVWNNAHFPFVADNPDPQDSRLERYYKMLATVDACFVALFKTLQFSNLTENTVLFGASDHGEAVTLSSEERYDRGVRPHSWVIHAVMWAHVPRLFLSIVQRERMVRWTAGVTSVLDIVPTLKEILGAPRAADDKATLLGVSLVAEATEQSMKSRVVIGYHGPPFIPPDRSIAVFSALDSMLIVFLQKRQRTLWYDFNIGQDLKEHEVMFQLLSTSEKASWRARLHELKGLPFVKKVQHHMRYLLSSD